MEPQSEEGGGEAVDKPGVLEPSDGETKHDEDMRRERLSNAPEAGPSSSGVTLCEECAELPAKYRCPGCGIQTCSLKCVKGHKERTQCSGVRDKLAYKPMGQLGDRELFTDISFLDDVKRVRDVARKTRPVPPRKDLPHGMKNLRFQARKRGVRLLFLQPGMKRRQENSTFYDRSKDQFSWRIEWHFHSVQGTFIDHRVQDSTVLSEILLGHLTLSKDNALEHHKLLEYVKKGVESIKVYLLAHKSKADKKEMHELDTKQTLSKLFIGKTIVEFPVLHCTLAEPVQDIAN